MMALTTVGDYQIVQEGLRRYMAVFLDVFGNTQASIPGDFAYADNQLWPYWNTGPSHGGPVDPRLTCPANAKLVGPDYYNFWPATLTDVEWNTNLYAQSKQGWPRGVGAWLNWAKSIGRPLCLGEWALMTKNTNPDGSRPAFGGLGQPGVHQEHAGLPQGQCRRHRLRQLLQPGRWRPRPTCPAT